MKGTHHPIRADKKTIQDLRIAISRKDDFIEWLFDHSEHCDHIPYSEAWKEFELWEEAQYLQDAPELLPNEQEDKRSVATNDATLTDDGKQNV